MSCELGANRREGKVGFLGTFGMGWSMVSSSPLASDSCTSMRNEGRPTTTTDAFYMDPIYFMKSVWLMCHKVTLPLFHLFCVEVLFLMTLVLVRAGRRTWRKRQTMTFTLSIFLPYNWRLQAQAIMWDKWWCGACGPPRSWTWVSWSHVEHGITILFHQDTTPVTIHEKFNYKLNPQLTPL